MLIYYVKQRKVKKRGRDWDGRKRESRKRESRKREGKSKKEKYYNKVNWGHIWLTNLVLLMKYKKTRTKTSIRYAKENDREKER